MTRVVERLAFELQRERESAAQERKIHLLETDKRFMQMEHRLLKGSHTDEDEKP